MNQNYTILLSVKKYCVVFNPSIFRFLVAKNKHYINKTIDEDVFK